LELLDLRDGLVHGGRHELVHLLGVVAFDELRRPAAATEELVQLLGLYAGQNRRVANLVAIQVQDRSTAPSVTGLRNLLECQAVARGPVSASPSPMTQATMRPGLSNAAPKA